LRVGAAPALFDHFLERTMDDARLAWWRGEGNRREWPARLGASLLGLLLAVCAVEVFFRLPTPLPTELGAMLFSCYDPEDTFQSVYFEDPKLGVPRFKPGYSTTCFWNGYRWRHEGDRWGFRNPESWDDIDVVLLGDSMTYGHGVEENQTIAHFLRSDLGARVANLGITGGGPVTYMAFLRNFALPLKPQIVVLILFTNDVEDVLARRTEEELQGYLESGRARELLVYDRNVLLEETPDPYRWSFERLRRWTLSYQALRFYQPRIRDWWEGTQVVAGPNGPRRVVEIPPEKREHAKIQGIAADYLRKLLGDMARFTRSAGAHLVVASLSSPYEFWRAEETTVPALWREIAEGERIPFLDLSAAITTARGDPLPGSVLLNDGHLSELGSRRVAGAIAAFVRERALFRTARP
jgi:lysophospholipase L1-like esterase